MHSHDLKLLFRPNQNPYPLESHLQLLPNASSSVYSEIDRFIHPPKCLFHGVSYTYMLLAVHKAPVWYLMLPSRDTIVVYMLWYYFTCLAEEVNTDLIKNAYSSLISQSASNWSQCCLLLECSWMPHGLRGSWKQEYGMS